MRRSARVVVTTVLAVGVALVGLSGCGRLGGANADPASESTELTWEEQALEAVGYTTEQLGLISDPAAAPAVTAAPSADKGKGDRRERFHKLRFAFKHTLHGEAVVQTAEGTKTVVVQRGVVTAVDATSLTVKSTDGYVITWTFGDPLTVVKERQKVEKSALAVGQEVGVAGAKEGDATKARLVVVPRTK